MELPQTTFVRLKDICLCIGITKHDLAKVIKAKLIHPVRLPGRKRGKYLRQEIMRVFLKGVSYEDMDMVTVNGSAPKRLRGAKK